MPEITNAQRARVSDFLYYTAGISLGTDKLDKLINAGMMIPEMFGIEFGTTGYATVYPDGRDEGKRSRVLWSGEPGDMTCHYAALDKTVSGTASMNWVKDFVPDPQPMTRDNVSNIATRFHGNWTLKDLIDAFEPYTTKEKE